MGVDRRSAEGVLGEGEVAEARQHLERRGGDLGADPVPWKHGDAHSHGPRSLWFWAADGRRDGRGAEAPRAASRPSGTPGARPSASPPRTRGCSTTARTSSSCSRWWPPRRTRRPRSSRRWARRSCTSARTCAGPSGHAYLIDPATGTLRPSGVWYLEDEARYAAFREASEDRDARPMAADPRHGHRRVGLGDRPRRGAEPEPPRGGARGRAARGLRLPDPHRHPAGRRARVLHRRPRHPGSGAAARHGPDRRPARAGGRARALARRARALQRRPRGLRLRRLARPGRAAALGRRASSRCSSASTATGWTTARGSSSPTRSTASSACSA